MACSIALTQGDSFNAAQLRTDLIPTASDARRTRTGVQTTVRGYSRLAPVRMAQMGPEMTPHQSTKPIQK